MRIARIGIAACVAVLVAQSIASLVASLGFHSYDSIVDLDRNNGIPDMVSTVAILCAAAGAAWLSVRTESVRLRAGTLSIALVLVAFEDVVQATQDHAFPAETLLLGTLAMVALLAVATSLAVPRPARLSMLSGLVVLVLAATEAYTYEKFLTASGYVYLSRGDALYELGIVLKQGLELAGWMLVAAGLLAGVAAVRGQPRRVPALEPT